MNCREIFPLTFCYKELSDKVNKNDSFILLLLEKIIYYVITRELK